ncbi:AAA family ATPase [Paenibacillus terrigena]|uniref:AAA family ATPase n=1 Tax=Paenibacillus terrigena TaxID=369333 RepID=UPI0028D4EA25|nr:AAA family ATPase [Paenibacillus terrigena]
MNNRIITDNGGGAMLQFAGYRFVEWIGSNEEIILCRMNRIEDNISVIAKTTRDTYPGSSMIAAFQEEYDLLCHFEGNGCIEPYAFIMDGERPVLLMRDHGGFTMAHLLHSSGCDLKLRDRIAIALGAVDCLLQLHQERTTHQELTPLHFIVNPDTHEVAIADIRMSTSREGGTPLRFDARLDSLLPYISPELTGRTGLMPDHRSDFYSLGIVLYEWFTGTLPFSPRDVADTVYHHLASKPEPMKTKDLTIPYMLSAIVDKCMAKMPEERYTSAYGLKYDLEQCYRSYCESGQIEPFVLGSKDLPERRLAGDGFYGRKMEQTRLLKALKRATAGSTEVVWVSGNGGIGKTSFVNETFRASGVGYVGSCKYDPHHTALPYEGWIQMINHLVDQVLIEDDLLVDVWKLRISHAVAGYGQLLIELVPRLELLIGKQPTVAPLPAVEAKQRFHLVLVRFIQLFLHQEQPLVLYLDDLQWSDDETLQCLRFLLEDRETSQLLVIGTYRDDVVQDTSPSPLQSLQEHVQSRARQAEHIRLTSLSITDLQQLLGDAMQVEQEDTKELAKILRHKTMGNPFFVRQFLQDLVDAQYIYLHEPSRKWQWDLERIAEMNIADNVAAYISDKLLHLPTETVFVIGRAAILGRKFNVDMLAALTNRTPSQCSEALHIAVHEQLLQVIGEERLTYMFQHDRIQQSAYLLVSDAERSSVHLQIGRLLADRMKEGHEEVLFEAANHFHLVSEQIIMDSEHRLLGAELSLQAGLKAKQSTAYETALGYLRNATDLLGEKGWESHYALTLQAFQERAEVEFLCAHFAEANDLFHLLIRKAVSDLEKARVYKMKIQIEANRDNYDEVIALGRTALKLLGMNHHFNPSTIELLVQWLKVKRKLGRQPLDSLQRLQTMTDEKLLLAMSILVHITNALFLTNKKGWLACTLILIQMTLDDGMSPEASIGFVGYALFTYYMFHQKEEAAKWGMLACDLAKPYPVLYVKVLTSFSLCFDSWRQYVPSLLETFSRQAGYVGLESGDLWHSNQSVLIHCSILLHYGHPLEDIYARLIAHGRSIRRNNNNLHWKQAAVFAALLVRLIGYRSPDDPYAETDVLIADFAESVHGDPTHLVQELVCTLQYLPGYVFGQYEEAKAALVKAAAIIASRPPFESDNMVHYLYESLVWAQCYEGASLKEQREYMAKLRKRMVMYRRYAKRSPENYAHKYLWIQAEIARLKRQNKQAELLYEQAIEQAKSNGLIHDLAMIAEGYGRYGLRYGRQQLAKMYMTVAYEAYSQWGAHAKVADLEEKYPHLLQVKRESELARIDYLSVVKSAQALSGEMEMNRLLHTLMHIMLHNAGAESGAIIFAQEGSWVVEAYGSVEEMNIASIPLQDASDILPVALIGYVARTREELVLHDASNEGMFMQNAYISSNKLKSVLCLPILHQNKLICLLYMENKLAPGVFTSDRLDVLKLLGSQCAISIKNAQLYSGIQYLKDHLEQQVEERTRSLERSMRETAAALSEMSVYAERNRIAHDIHDIVGHTLTSTILQIEAGKRLLNKDREEASNRLKEAQDLVRHGLHEIRSSVHMLKEDKYYDLVQALHQLIEETQRNTGAVIHASIGMLPELTLTYKKTIYHAVQEGLTNGIRHGESKEFYFTLEYVKSMIKMKLKDCGIGASEIHLGFGLTAMRERVEQLGGQFVVDSEPDQGCLLRIELPYSMRDTGGLDAYDSNIDRR